jgi:HJR/Mrr/RecB family endonuclease
MNRRRKALLESPEDARDIRNDMYKDLFGVSIDIPKVTVKPKLEAYGLSSDMESYLRTQDAISREQKLKSAKNNFWIKAAIVVLLNLVSVATLQENVWQTIILISVIALPIMYVWATDSNSIEPDQTELHRKFNKYQKDFRDYEYWQRKNDINHWSKLGGHEFEASVASIFRSIGFKATVSRRGGDGGIDIVLEKPGRRIAVQCKRYKKSVGPHVIRDLWGTMNVNGYDEGCIVTTTGFTSGVKSFASDKKIHLVDLNDILRSVNDPNYLIRLIG